MQPRHACFPSFRVVGFREKKRGNRIGLRGSRWVIGPALAAREF